MSMHRHYLFFCLCALLLLWASPLRAAEEFRFGDGWLENSVFRLATEPQPLHPSAPFVCGYRKENEAWKKVFTGVLSGSFIGNNAVVLQQRYGTPFINPGPEKKDAPLVTLQRLRTGVRNDAGFFSCVLRQGEFVVEFTLRLPPGQPLVIFTATTGQPIQPGAVLYLPKNDQSFSQLTYGATRLPARPLTRDVRELGEHWLAVPARYLAAYRPDTPAYVIYTWPDNPIQPRALWPYHWRRDLPFAVYFGVEDVMVKDGATMGHFGEGVRTLALPYFSDKP